MNEQFKVHYKYPDEIFEEFTECQKEIIKSSIGINEQELEWYDILVCHIFDLITHEGADDIVKELS